MNRTTSSYNAWGGVRAGHSHGYPNHHYCAKLGHIADDETGLTYMRARYYEHSTGRFISEDPARDGWNWHVYCGNDPLNFIDSIGLWRFKPGFSGGVAATFLSLALIMTVTAGLLATSKATQPAAADAIIVASALAAVALAGVDGIDDDHKTTSTLVRLAATNLVFKAVAGSIANMLGKELTASFTSKAITTICTFHAVVLLGALLLTYETE